MTLSRAQAVEPHNIRVLELPRDVPVAATLHPHHAPLTASTRRHSTRILMWSSRRAQQNLDYNTERLSSANSCPALGFAMRLRTPANNSTLRIYGLTKFTRARCV